MKRIMILTFISAGWAMEPYKIASPVSSLTELSLSVAAQSIIEDVKKSVDNVQDSDSLEELLKKVAIDEAWYLAKLPRELKQELMSAIVRGLPSLENQLMKFTLVNTFTGPIDTTQVDHTIQFNPHTNTQLLLSAFGVLEDTYIINHTAPDTNKFIHVGGHQAVTYSADGDYIVTSDGRQISVYSANTGHFVRRWNEEEPILGLTCNRYDNTIFVVTPNKVSIWNLIGERLRSFHRTPSSRDHTIVCNAAGTEIAVLNSMESFDFTMYNLQNGSERHIEQNPAEAEFIEFMTYHPGHPNNLIFGINEFEGQENQSAITEWNRESESFFNLFSLRGELKDLASNPNPALNQFAITLRNSANNSGSVVIFTSSEEQSIFSIKKPSGALAYSADGTLLAITYDPNLIHIYKNMPIISFDSLTLPQIYFLALTSRFKSKHAHIALASETQPIATKIYKQLAANVALMNRLAKVWSVTDCNPLSALSIKSAPQRKKGIL